MAVANPNDPNDNPRSEIEKLGTGQPIDIDLLYEQMDEDRMDRLIDTVKRLPVEVPEAPPTDTGQP